MKSFETFQTKVYWLGRIERRVSFLKLKLSAIENKWELKELEALEWALVECKRALKTDAMLLRHFAKRFKEVSGAESNGSIDRANSDLSPL